MAELLPAEPAKGGWYWVQLPDRQPVFALWKPDWKLWTSVGNEDWSPSRLWEIGYRLAWPHPLLTPDQLKALQPLTQRQPIATAPRDGTAVDLWEQYTDNDKLVWMRWPACKWLDGEWKRMDWDIGDYIENPGCTHWTAIVA